jgi:hypothetical protein
LHVSTTGPLLGPESSPHSLCRILQLNPWAFRNRNFVGWVQQPIQSPWRRAGTRWGTRSQCIRKFLRPGISPRVFSVSLRLQANVVIIPKFLVDTAHFSCMPIQTYQN